MSLTAEPQSWTGLRNHGYVAEQRETAIVVELPELDTVLDQYRQALDPSWRWGMPAHLTVLYPFVWPVKLDQAVLSKLVEVASKVRPFDAEFDTFGWFGNQVVWLAPSHAEPFESLILRMMDAFPECPPYRGAFDEVVPHVTVGEGSELDLLRAATDAIRPQLPLRSSVSSLSLMAGSPAPGSWHVIERIALGNTR